MNYVFMIIMIYFFFFALSVAVKCATCFTTSEILSNTLCKTDFTTKMRKKTIFCGIVSDLLSVAILPLVFIIQNQLGYDSLLGTGDMTFYNYFYCIFFFAIYPDYSATTSNANWHSSTFQPILLLIITSVLIGVLFNYLFVLRKTKLNKRQKIWSLIILAITTAPYYFLISFGSLMDPLARI